MFDTIRRDIRAARERDPACRSTLEVIFCYPGFHAVLMHRLAHRCWRKGFLLLARFLSHVNRFLTGIEIHPAVRIGPGLFVDHGMGVVIGETAEIGQNVTLYQGVTLGGTSLKREKRHPTLEDGVVVGAGAKVLGAITLGTNCKVGAGSVVIRDVPPDTTVVGVPGKVVYEEGKRSADVPDVDWMHLPDPVAKAIECILAKVVSLERELEALKKEKEGEELLTHHPNRPL